MLDQSGGGLITHNPGYAWFGVPSHSLRLLCLRLNTTELDSQHESNKSTFGTKLGFNVQRQGLFCCIVLAGLVG